MNVRTGRAANEQWPGGAGSGAAYERRKGIISVDWSPRTNTFQLCWTPPGRAVTFIRMFFCRIQRELTIGRRRGPPPAGAPPRPVRIDRDRSALGEQSRPARVPLALGQLSLDRRATLFARWLATSRELPVPRLHSSSLWPSSSRPFSAPAAPLRPTSSESFVFVSFELSQLGLFLYRNAYCFVYSMWNS